MRAFVAAAPDGVGGAACAVAVAVTVGAPVAAGASDAADRQNRALTDVFEPGSTSKVVTLAAALDTDLVAMLVYGSAARGDYREGDLVKKGQLLFEIDPRTFEAAVDEAAGIRAQKVARLDTTSANLARIKPLAEKNAVSQKDLDDATGAFQSAKAELEAADANLKTAKLNLGFTKITSPITGIAGIAKAQIGDLLSPSGGELTTVSSVDPIKVYFNISEQEYLKVATAADAAGKKAQDVPLDLILVDGSIYGHRGKVSVLNRQVDVATGTFKVASLFPNPNNLLRPGQFGRIRATMQRSIFSRTWSESSCALPCRPSCAATCGCGPPRNPSRTSGAQMST